MPYTMKNKGGETGRRSLSRPVEIERTWNVRQSKQGTGNPRDESEANLSTRIKHHHTLYIIHHTSH